MRKLLIAPFLGFAAASLAVFPDIPSNVPGLMRAGDTSGMTITTNGSAVAVSPTWVLCAWHVGATKLEQNGQIYNILQTVSHPTADIKLFRVDRPIQTAVPLKLDLMPSVPTVQTSLPGIVAKLCGFGLTGTQTATQFTITNGSQGILRSANNAIDLFAPQVAVQIGSNTRTSDYYFYDLDDPAGVSGPNTIGGSAIAGEGGIATWDSGGGWLVQDGARLKLAAINSIVGTFGGGVPSPYHWGGVGGGVCLQSYASWLTSSIPDLGRAILNSIEFDQTTTTTGDTTSVFEFDALSFTTKTRTSTFSPLSPFAMKIKGTTTVSNPTNMVFTCKSRTNDHLTYMTLKMKNWNTGQFEGIGTFWLGKTDRSIVTPFSGVSAFVDPSGKIEARLEGMAFGAEAVFFNTFWDVIRFDVN